MLRQVFHGRRRHILEFGRDRAAGIRQRFQRGRVVIGGAQVYVGNAAGRAVLVGIENGDAIAQFMGGNDKEAAELAAAQHAQHIRR